MKTTLTSGCPKIVSEKLCVVYQGDTGKIVHFHAVTHFEGSPEIAESEIHSRALDLARRCQPSASPVNIKTCLVDPESEQPGCTHRIDPATLRLVATPRSARH